LSEYPSSDENDNYPYPVPEELSGENNDNPGGTF
jgi:hypothetical protein